MSKKVWAIRVHLVNGETRHLSNSTGTAEEATACLQDLKNHAGKFNGDWFPTTDSTIVAQADVVEAHVVPLPEPGEPVFATK